MSIFADDLNKEKKMSYKASDKMVFVISSDFKLLQVMSRFGLSLGFGDKTVYEICESNGIDCQTFLDVVNFLNDEKINTERISSLHIPTLMLYLKNAHKYFLDFKLPGIRRKLIESIDCSVNNEIAFLILKFYDAYVEEVRKHMLHENEEVFRYVDALLEDRLQKDFNIQIFASHHDDVEAKLSELKNIIITYCPTSADNNLFNAVLFDIFICEQDLASHNSVENNLFVPAVSLLEKDVAKRVNIKTSKDDAKIDQIEREELSNREKEIVVCVAKGMANKEIADHLFISIHTVFTHRKNVSKKLNIHSVAGLTIYAIVNKLVKLEDIKDLSIL